MPTGDASGRPDILVIHETNGRKYLEALVLLQGTSRIGSLEFFEASVLWKFFHSVFRERKPLIAALLQSMRNLRLRLTLRRVRGMVVILLLPPWDHRLLFYARLRRNNRLVYNTSWPWWNMDDVPRRYGLLSPWLRRAWLSILAEPGVTLTAVTGAAAEGLAVAVPANPAVVISHAVSDAFFVGKATYAIPFRLLFVGQLLKSKGLIELRVLMDTLVDMPVVLDIVGDGSLRAMAKDLALRPGCRWHGEVQDREQLAQIAADCQAFVSLAVRTRKWQELFGMAILEGMASGLPCIASDHVGPRSIISSGVNGWLVPDGATEEAAAHVRHMIGDHRAWDAMSDAARATASRYTVRETARRWQELFTTLDGQ